MNKLDELSHIRKQYVRGSLDWADVSSHPLEQLKCWVQEAKEAGQLEPTAMCLSTLSATQRISSRIVLLKGIDEGLLFFTNLESRKGQELAANPSAAVNFFWDILERQVRVEGRIERLPKSFNQEYFDSRPLESRISAIVSKQSSPVPDRTYLEKEVAAYKETLGPEPQVTCPDYWGGYRLIPDYFEFWQGRRNRLHDRLTYSLDLNTGMWKQERLAP